MILNCSHNCWLLNVVPLLFLVITTLLVHYLFDKRFLKLIFNLTTGFLTFGLVLYKSPKQTRAVAEGLPKKLGPQSRSGRSS